VGLSEQVKEAYRWLTTTYEPGDRVELFGFSRGAYTARSLAGMIGACGLLDCAGKDERAIRRLVDDVYQRGYRKPDNAWRGDLTFLFDPAEAEKIPVWFIGVWDTVGSLGIPDNLGLLNLWDRSKRYAFHNVALNPHIRHARHAVAMDEPRVPFAPTLWKQVDDSEAHATQVLKQVYFPGSHMDVGGGHVQDGLSNGALHWMVEEATKEAGLAFDEQMLGQAKADPGGPIHEDDRSALRFLGPLYDPLVKPVTEPFLKTRPRKVPRLDPLGRSEAVHDSAYMRHDLRILTARPYRKARVPQADHPETLTVRAREPWNDTELYLEPGTYTLTAVGEWGDGGIWCGPEGTRGPAMLNPFSERLRLVGTAFGQLEGVFRRVTGNDQADLIGSRREDDLPWMSLVAAVANEDGRDGGQQALASSPDPQLPHQRIAVGRGTPEVTVHVGGYLYAFANDAWGFYGNNSGSLRLTVIRTG